MSALEGIGIIGFVSLAITMVVFGLVAVAAVRKLAGIDKPKPINKDEYSQPTADTKFSKNVWKTFWSATTVVGVLFFLLVMLGH
jgi:hypothetical protein